MLNPEILKDFLYLYQIRVSIDTKKRRITIPMSCFQIRKHNEVFYLYDAKRLQDFPTDHILFENDAVGIKNFLSKGFSIPGNKKKILIHLITKTKINTFNCQEFLRSVCNSFLLKS